jgi:transposase
MPEGLVTMSGKEIDRLAIVGRVVERRLSQKAAARMMGLSTRQVRRMCRAFERHGAAGLASKRRGRPSNHRIGYEIQSLAIALVRERYADFGPTLASEKLAELHSLRISRETLRTWMAAAGLWKTRKDRVATPHQPRARRECFGELVQIDGSEHAWFEGRGPTCTLLVYVDDATGRLMELRFARVESAFDYFEATTSYLKRHGKPVAFYSDKHSIFRVAREGTTGPGHGVTQFARALGQLNIDIICANTPQAKGRVERMNRSLQDRLVKELRLRGISDRETANAFMPAFVDDYNARFARPARKPHDAHRPLQPYEDLARIFSWQETRTMTRNLVVHYRRATYLIGPTAEARALAGAKRRVDVHENADGSIDIRYEGRSLPYTVYEKRPLVAAGEIVENKRLDGVLAAVKSYQDRRDEARLHSRKLSLRGKDRLRAARTAAGVTGVPAEPAAAANGASRVADYIEGFIAEQTAKHKRRNDVTNRRKRDRELANALKRQTGTEVLARGAGISNGDGDALRAIPDGQRQTVAHRNAPVA